MTGLRTIDETIPSTLHTLSRSLRRTHFRRGVTAIRPRSAIKIEQSMMYVRIHSTLRHDGIARDRGSTTFFFLRDAAVQRPRVYRSFVSETRDPKTRLSGRESVSVVQFDSLDAPSRVTSKRANSQTRMLNTQPSPCNSTKERISKRN